MATKYSVDVFDTEASNWECIALVSDVVPIDILAVFGRAVWDNAEGISDVAIIDRDTGEVFWNATSECWQDREPADIDSDCGFDPYMGCFSDDC